MMIDDDVKYPKVEGGKIYEHVNFTSTDESIIYNEYKNLFF